MAVADYYLIMIPIDVGVTVHSKDCGPFMEVTVLPTC